MQFESWKVKRISSFENLRELASKSGKSFLKRHLPKINWDFSLPKRHFHHDDQGHFHQNTSVEEAEFKRSPLSTGVKLWLLHDKSFANFIIYRCVLGYK